MFDREQAIKAVQRVMWECADPMDRHEAERIVEAILALPVTVSDEMVERAYWAQERHWQAHEGEDDYGAMRAALVAALTPPREPGERDGHA